MAKIIPLYLLVLLFILTFKFSDSWYRKKKLDVSTFMKVIKETKPSLNFALPTPKLKNKQDSTFQRLQAAYDKYQQKYYQEALKSSGEMLEGFSETQAACRSCRGNKIGKDRTQCYASCMTRQLDVFIDFAMLIGETVQNFFCVPLGFNFDILFGEDEEKSPIFYSFEQFRERFNEDNDTAMSSLVDTWMSNVLWLDKSPLYLHVYIRTQMALEAGRLQPQSSPLGIDSFPEDVAATSMTQCGSKWDLSESVYSLINAANGKSHYLDIIFRGLYTARSAAFYTLGEYHNLAGGMIEALGALIGAKCDIISYSLGQKASEDICDGFGKYPIPRFPVPSIFGKIIPPCEEKTNVWPTVTKLPKSNFQQHKLQ